MSVQAIVPSATSVMMSKDQRAHVMLLENAIASCEDALAALKRARGSMYEPDIAAKVSMAAEYCAKTEHKILRLMMSLKPSWQLKNDNTGTVTVDPELMKPNATVIDVVPVVVNETVLDPDGEAV